MSATQIKTLMDGHRARISLVGRFDFSTHRDFHDAYQQPLRNPVVTEIEVDLGSVDYLDSSALGMLLLLRERADGIHKSMCLTNCRGVVSQILDVVNFDKLFVIS